MTTANPEGTRPRRFELPGLPTRLRLRRQLAHVVATESTVRPRTWFGSLRAALDRPLTSYYLLVGASALLLTIGLIMVLSASSVYSYEVNDGDSYAVVRRQLVWVLIGLPLAWVASRLSHRWVRRLAYPGFSISLVLLLLTAFFGVERNGNQNWLGIGPVVIQPSEIAKLAMVIWAAHIYANKERRLSSTHEIIVPVVPGMILATGLVVLGNDLGTALVLWHVCQISKAENQKRDGEAADRGREDGDAVLSDVKSLSKRYTSYTLAAKSECNQGFKWR